MLDPSSLSSLTLWLRAKDLGSDGSSVASWPDQSGASHDGTAVGTAPTIVESSTTLGGKSVRFSGSGHFTFGSIMSAGTPGEMWIVIKSDGVTTRSSWKFGTNSNQNHYPYSGVIYDDFGSATRNSFTPTLPVTSWHIYRVYTDGTVWRAEINGSTQFTASSQPISWRSNIQIGASLTGPGFLGNIAEVLVREAVSTTQEAIDIYDYLSREHLSSITTAMIYGTYGEIIAAPSSTPRIIYGAYGEALASVAQPPRLLYGGYVEILTPSTFEYRHKGWGTPL